MVYKEQYKASFYSIIIYFILITFLIIYKWQIKFKPLKISEDFIEVNLGNDNLGNGNEAILKQGEKGEDIKDNTQEKQIINNITPKENEDLPESIKSNDDEPEINQNTKKKEKLKQKIETKKIIPKLKPINQIEDLKTKQPITYKKEIVTPTITPAPPIPITPKPKAIFIGGKGNGNGNNFGITNNVQSQGIEQSNKGDMGKPNGNINSNNYNGNGGNGNLDGTKLNVSSELRERGIVNIPTIEADFNQNAKITVEIKVDEEGNANLIRVIKTNTTNSDFIKIIKQNLQKIKFKSKNVESFGTIEFNFKVNE